jgi:hypothetical protein
MKDAVTGALELLLVVDRYGLARPDDALSRATTLEVLMRSAQLLAVAALRSVRDSYPATNQFLFQEPEAEIVVARDALVDGGDFLRFADLLDLLSEESLPCVASRLHRGWQDRVQSCREARRVSQEAAGFSLGPEERAALLSGLAVANRVFRIPPPLDLDAKRGAAGFDALLRLIERLAPSDQASAFRDLTSKLASTASPA